MSSFLNKIRDSVLERVNALNDVPKRTAQAPLLFSKSLRNQNGSTVAVIAEIKRASPSQGILYADANAVGVAKSYVKNGATALSILTEPHYFNGSLDDLKRVREALPQTPLLMKDFILDERQIAYGHAFGADAVLLMMSFVSPEKIVALKKFAEGLGLSVLVEVHNLEELKQAMALGATLIGINNRNLHDLTVSLKTSEQLVATALASPTPLTLVSESGIESLADLQTLKGLKFHAALVGTSLMKNQQPGASLASLLGKSKP